jgi:hypothetical protein
MEANKCLAFQTAQLSVGDNQEVAASTCWIEEGEGPKFVKEVLESTGR